MRDHASLWQQVRMFREAVKDTYNCDDVKAYDDLITCLAKHATCIYNRYILHWGGHTSYERRRNRHYGRSIFVSA